MGRASGRHLADESENGQNLLLGQLVYRGRHFVVPESDRFDEMLVGSVTQ
jgi:hypothetical protein